MVSSPVEFAGSLPLGQERFEHDERVAKSVENVPNRVEDRFPLRTLDAG
jgi:hypothetical protein